MSPISMSLVLPPRGSRRLLSPSSIAPSLSASRARTSVGATSLRPPPASPRIICCADSLPSSAVVAATVAVTASNGRPEGEQREIRLGPPSKGRMADDTLGLLKDCQLSVKQVNPRQCVAEIPHVWNFHEKRVPHIGIDMVSADGLNPMGNAETTSAKRKKKK